MQITLSLTRAEAEAVLRAHLSSGHGVRRSKVLETAEEKLRRAIAKAQHEPAPAPTPCTTADCEEPGTVPGVFDDGDCHERVTYCSGCAYDLSRGGEFTPDAA